MTFSQFKYEFDLVRDKCRDIRSLDDELDHLEEERLKEFGNGAIDYSVDRVQHSTDPDKAMIYKLDSIDREKAKKKARRSRLREEIEPFETMIYNADGIGATVGRRFVLDGLPMKEVSRILNYHVSRCYGFWNRTMRELYEQGGWANR